MSRKITGILLALWSMLLLSPHVGEAATLTVPTDQYPNIASALDAAANNSDLTDTIILKRGTYRETVVMRQDVTLQGEETARTVIDGSGSGTVITAASGSVIQRLTVTNGDIGIAIPNSATSARVINVIITQQKGHGIQCTSAINPTITNNTLNGNGTAITCTNSSGVTIQNNIVTNNTTDMNLDTATLNSSTNSRSPNLFFGNTSTPYVDANIRNKGTTDILEDPLFVNRNSNDFHLKTGSPAIKNQSDPTDDIGAYGGTNADPDPFPVSNLRWTATTDSITVTWDPNLAYNVQGYKVYYNSDQPGTPANPSPVVTPTTYIITIPQGSVTTPDKPGAPSNLSAGIGDGELFLGWSPVNPFTVSGYKIYYGTTPGVYGVPINVDGRLITSYPLTGLMNKTTYYIVISAIAKPVYFVTVTVLDNASTPHESDYAPVQEAHLTSPVAESSLSTEISATPEPIARFPNLQDEGGCFIATAAYGSPLEPHVQVLRAFRDQYLLTHAVGRDLVALYYQMSPPIARWLEEHAAFKPAARVILSPIVFGAALWMGATSIGKTLMFGVILFLVGLPLYRWGMPLRRGRY